MAALPIAATLTQTAKGTTPTNPAASVNFHGWDGWVDGLSIQIDRERRMGQNGSVAQGTGKISDDTAIKAYRYEKSATLATAFAASMENLPSPTPYNVTDPWGRKMTIRVVGTKCRVQKGRGPIDGSGQTTHQITVDITVERMPDA